MLPESFCWLHALTPRVPVMVREFIEGWDLVQILGEGTFAEVKLLVNKENGEACAMKEIDLQVLLLYLIAFSIKKAPEIVLFHLDPSRSCRGCEKGDLCSQTVKAQEHSPVLRQPPRGKETVHLSRVLQRWRTLRQDRTRCRNARVPRTEVLQSAYLRWVENIKRTIIRISLQTMNKCECPQVWSTFTPRV